MNGFNPNVKVDMYGESQIVMPEIDERIATPMEVKLGLLSDTERQELLQDALAQYSDLESLIHAITSMDESQQDRLF